jgi:hypothetical protein
MLGAMPAFSSAWRLTALHPTPSPGQPYRIGKVMCRHVQVRDYPAKNGSRDSLVVPAEGEFQHVRAPDNRRSTARHNSSKIAKVGLFPGSQGTGCQFSIWRAVGGGSPKTLDMWSFFHSAPFRMMARCGGTFVRRVTRHALSPFAEQRGYFAALARSAAEYFCSFGGSLRPQAR